MSRFRLVLGLDQSPFEPDELPCVVWVPSTRIISKQRCDSAHRILGHWRSEASRRLERVLTNDPAMGVFRHADAGYGDATRCARERGAKVPMA